MRAKGSVRFSLGRYNTEAEVDEVLEKLPPIIRKLRELSPVSPDQGQPGGGETPAGGSIGKGVDLVPDVARAVGA
jgi:hypothetical protein